MMTRPLRVFVAVACVLAGGLLGLGAVRDHRASASETPPGPAPSPSASAPPIVKLDGSSKPPKPAPPLVSAALSVDGCVVAAYAKLASETSALQAAHAGDPAWFSKAYKARKEALVGTATLRAAGCKRPGEK